VLDTLHTAIVVVTLVGVAAGRYPRLHMDRAAIALVGATALVVAGALPLHAAFEAVDLDTLALLLGMMILNAHMRIAGFFTLAAGWMVTRAHTPRALLAMIIVLSGSLSALFLNDTIVLAMTPLVLELVLALGLNPVPYLVALVTAANIGSAATLIGNPQNMLIGTASGIGFIDFAAALAVPALLGLAWAWVVIVTLFHAELAARRLELPAPSGDGRTRAPAPDRALLAKSLAAAVLLLAALLLGAPPSLAALAAASLMLVTRRLESRRVFAHVDWGLLVFFAALFVVSAAAERTALMPPLLALAAPAIGHGTGAFSALAAVVSNLVSNVPAVMLLRPAVAASAEPDRAWLVLAMATTFAGNLTLLGSVANLIVAETARSQGVTLSFLAYLGAGVPVTLGSLVIGAWWLAFT